MSRRRRAQSTNDPEHQSTTVSDRRCSYCNQTQAYFNTLTETKAQQAISDTTLGDTRVAPRNRLLGCDTEGCIAACVCLGCMLEKRVALDTLECMQSTEKSKIYNFGSETTVTLLSIVETCDVHGKDILRGAIALVRKPVPWVFLEVYGVPEWIFLVAVVMLLLSTAIPLVHLILADIPQWMMQIYIYIPHVTTFLIIILQIVGKAFASDLLRFRIFTILYSIATGHAMSTVRMGLIDPVVRKAAVHVIVLGLAYAAIHWDPMALRHRTAVHLLRIDSERRV